MNIDERHAIADLTANAIICTKEVLTSDETALYMGVSKSYLYKLMMRKEIPYYKPMGKICYFNRRELEQWLQQNRCTTNSEIEEEIKAVNLPEVLREMASYAEGCDPDEFAGYFAEISKIGLFHDAMGKTIDGTDDGANVATEY